MYVSFSFSIYQSFCWSWCGDLWLQSSSTWSHQNQMRSAARRRSGRLLQNMFWEHLRYALDCLIFFVLDFCRWSLLVCAQQCPGFISPLQHILLVLSKCLDYTDILYIKAAQVRCFSIFLATLFVFKISLPHMTGILTQACWKFMQILGFGEYIGEVQAAYEQHKNETLVHFISVRGILQWDSSLNFLICYARKLDMKHLAENQYMKLEGSLFQVSKFVCNLQLQICDSIPNLLWCHRWPWALHFL